MEGRSEKIRQFERTGEEINNTIQFTYSFDLNVIDETHFIFYQIILAKEGKIRTLR